MTVGNTTAAPTTAIAADAINGASTYLDDVATNIATWTGSGIKKAFTAIDANGNLPQLKAAEYDADGQLTMYSDNAVIPGQPSKLTSDYLALPDPLSLPTGDTDLITLSRSDNKWSYTKGESGTSARFNGRIKMDASSVSTNKLMVATVTGNPTLTFEQVTINATGGAALTVNEGCDLTIASDADSKLSASGASTLINKGTLRLSGDFRIETPARPRRITASITPAPSACLIRARPLPFSIAPIPLSITPAPLPTLGWNVGSRLRRDSLALK